MYTDADIEMIQIAEAGTLIRWGVCPNCEEALDPWDDKWGLTKAEATSIESCYGEPSTTWDGMHTRCAKEMAEGFWD